MEIRSDSEKATTDLLFGCFSFTPRVHTRLSSFFLCKYDTRKERAFVRRGPLVFIRIYATAFIYLDLDYLNFGAADASDLAWGRRLCAKLDDHKGASCIRTSVTPRSSVESQSRINISLAVTRRIV